MCSKPTNYTAQCLTHCPLFFIPLGEAQFLIWSTYPGGDVRFKIFLTPTLLLTCATEGSRERIFSCLYVEGEEQRKVTAWLSSTWNLNRQLCRGCAWSFLKDTSSSYDRVCNADRLQCNPAACSITPEALSCAQQSHISVLIPENNSFIQAT